MRRTPSLFCLLFLLLAVGACKPAVGRAPSLVVGPEILAIKGDPAEVSPDASVSYRFLMASPSGTVTDAQGAWDVCLQPKPPSESNSVASACVAAPSGADVGATFTAPVPSDACSLFGPNAPAAKQGQPPLRPRDPDITGGYYVPVRLLADNGAGGTLMAFDFERVFCGVGSAPLTAIQDYNTRYKKNTNPTVQGLAVIASDGTGTRTDILAGPATVASGSAVALVASASAGSAETFPVYDSVAQVLNDQVEILSLSWFASDGKFKYDRNDADSTSLEASNTWTAPQVAASEDIPLWVVMRDSRGGVDFVSTTLTVVP
jgi:hypothetical protein